MYLPAQYVSHTHDQCNYNDHNYYDGRNVRSMVSSTLFVALFWAHGEECYNTFHIHWYDCVHGSYLSNYKNYITLVVN